LVWLFLRKGAPFANFRLPTVAGVKSMFHHPWVFSIEMVSH
jgi:hypothetical protein